SEHTGVIMGKQQWRSLVEEAISDDAVTFRFQAANSSGGETYHREVFSAIEMNGERYTANQYLLALEQLDASHIFDEHVIMSVINKLEREEMSDSMAINITPTSIAQPSFIRWISQVLAK
ncbi:EAL domain-containing protein, partial [Vibrio alfacsensis]